LLLSSSLEDVGAADEDAAVEECRAQDTRNAWPLHVAAGDEMLLKFTAESQASVAVGKIAAKSKEVQRTQDVDVRRLRVF